MTTLLLSHDDCLLHETPTGHPECSDRLRVLKEVFCEPEFNTLLHKKAPLGTQDMILLVHSESYLATIQNAIQTNQSSILDEDTFISSGTWHAALRGVGAATTAVDAIISGQAHNAFCVIRPPGHHAESDRAMGFCIFNNAAIAARFALTKYGLSRIAIMDFDVHHGNGTQNIFWNDASVLYCSTHQMPLFPGTGRIEEVGAHENIINVPLYAGDDGIQFRSAIKSQIAPIIHRFQPELIIISAGFDAHAQDPLANINLITEDFEFVTDILLELADKHASGRIISVLEGGYNLESLKESVRAHVRRLMAAYSVDVQK